MSQVLFSFDIEEFDMPLEYGQHISLQEQIKVSTEGTAIILSILKKHNITATFFSTATFAAHSTELIKRICAEGHELASHGYFHSKFEESDLFSSKKELEKLSGQQITGFRMARMMPVNQAAVAKAGYEYNSSLNPTFLPGRYNNFFKPRVLYKEGNLIQFPASVTPILRIPLFWLSFHNFPLWFYQRACLSSMKKDHYLNLYFHPWEFTDLTLPEYKFPSFISKNSGTQMIDRFDQLILWMKKQRFSFSTISHFLKNC